MWLREWAFYERVKGRTKCQEKIAVITARADDRTQKDIICGIAEEAFAADTDMVVFSNIYNHWIRGEFLNDRFIIQVQHSKKVMTHKATRVIMGVTTQPQTGGAKCVITLILPQKSGSCQEF